MAKAKVTAEDIISRYEKATTHEELGEILKLSQANPRSMGKYPSQTRTDVTNAMIAARRRIVEAENKRKAEEAALNPPPEPEPKAPPPRPAPGDLTREVDTETLDCLSCSRRGEPIDGFVYVCIDQGEDRRWSRTNTLIFKDTQDDSHWGADFEEGLTEQQDVERWTETDHETVVCRRMEARQKTITEWVASR